MNQKNQNRTLLNIPKWLWGLVLFVIVINVISQYFFFRIDLTKEKRFTISESTERLFSDIDDVLYIKIYLEGEFPAGFKMVQEATKDMLHELQQISGSDLQFEFINPLDTDDFEEKKEITKKLVGKGLIPRRLIENQDAYSEKIFFPGAVASYKGRETAIVLVEEQLNKSPEEAIQESIALLEYKFGNALQKLNRTSPQYVAFLEGHGELPTQYVDDIGIALQSSYEIVRHDIWNSAHIPNRFDVLVIAKPTEKFEESNKFKIDQFIMNGGKVLWLVDQLRGSLDSLQFNQGEFLAVDYGLNLDDMLFKYGARFNYSFLQDLQCNVIPLAVGTDESGNATSMKNFPWPYHPVLTNFNQNHPVSKNQSFVISKFCGSIDTIKTPNIKKSILLSTSSYTKEIHSPAPVNLQMVRQKPDQNQYNKKHLPVAVSLEGTFTSVFKNRVSPQMQSMIDTLENVTFTSESKETKMILVADGDMIANEIDFKNARPYPLGYYKFSGETFGNKQFLLNAIEWLMDENGVIETRSKDVSIRLLDQQKIKEESVFWQLLNVVVPSFLILLFGLIFNFYRKNKYAK